MTVVPLCAGNSPFSPKRFAAEPAALGWLAEVDVKTPRLTRRGFIATALAERLVPVVVTKLAGRRGLQLVVDRTSGPLRAVARLVE